MKHATRQDVLQCGAFFMPFNTSFRQSVQRMQMLRSFSLDCKIFLIVG